MKIKFTKMQGAGNDYIYVDTLKYPILNPERFAVEWSCPHTGIGSDGLVLIGPSDKADFSMRIFNADGSEAKIDYMWTFVCKQMSDLIYLINPIVYDSAIKCCQWSAFFRYVKANYPDEWRSFKADVQRLRYDAPEVVTPINLHRDEP